MLGATQEMWLRTNLQRSHAQWNVLAQQVMMARVNFAPALPAPLLNLDAWDGVTAARNRLLGFVRDGGVGNVVVLTETSTRAGSPI
jgi:alkaline phosphatase D